MSNVSRTDCSVSGCFHLNERLILRLQLPLRLILPLPAPSVEFNFGISVPNIASQVTEKKFWILCIIWKHKGVYNIQKVCFIRE